MVRAHPALVAPVVLVVDGVGAQGARDALRITSHCRDNEDVSSPFATLNAARAAVQLGAVFAPEALLHPRLLQVFPRKG